MWPNDLGSKFALLNSLFSAVQLTKNAYLNKYSYSGYGVGFDGRGTFFEFGKTIVIEGVNNSFSVHVDNRKKIY